MVVLPIIVRHFLFVLFFGRSTLSSIGRSHVGSTNEDQKRLAHDVVHTSASVVHDVTDTLPDAK